MKLRLLVLGNSHLAALADGWRANPGRWPGVECHFVGAHGERLLETELRGGVLTPASPEAAKDFARFGGGKGVALADFDAIVIAGGHVALAAAALVWREMRWSALPSLDAVPDLATMKPALVSRAAASAALVALLAERLGPRLARRLRAGCDLPLWITSQPRLSETVLDTPRPTARAQIEALRQGDAPALSALFDEAADIAATAAGAHFVPQPAATISHAILTARSFTQYATRLAARPGTAQPQDDVMHANGAFGALMLDALLAAIPTTGPAAPSPS